MFFFAMSQVDIRKEIFYNVVGNAAHTASKRSVFLLVVFRIHFFRTKDDVFR